MEMFLSSRNICILLLLKLLSVQCQGKQGGCLINRASRNQRTCCLLSRIELRMANAGTVSSSSVVTLYNEKRERRGGERRGEERRGEERRGEERRGEERRGEERRGEERRGEERKKQW